MGGEVTMPWDDLCGAISEQHGFSDTHRLTMPMSEIGRTQRLVIQHEKKKRVGPEQSRVPSIDTFLAQKAAMDVRCSLPMSNQQVCNKDQLTM